PSPTKKASHPTQHALLLECRFISGLRMFARNKMSADRGRRKPYRNKGWHCLRELSRCACRLQSQVRQTALVAPVLEFINMLF
ncbi:hypothetical protein ACSZOE_23285, partial [Aeromonas hydrophila]